ncbi:MAG TPA: STAS domain-containing protein [Candidatus Xenobia bacterium]|jgi:anti-sigma B factor antagonist
MSVLDIVSHQTNGVITLELSGEVDAASCPRLRETLRGAMDQGVHPIHLNLRQVSFIESSGLKVLLEAAARLQGERRPLVIDDISHSVQRVFRLVNMEALLSN